MYYFLKDIASHKLLSITGMKTEVLTLVEGDAWATSWTDQRDAAKEAERLMNDFSHELAGVVFEIVRG